MCIFKKILYRIHYANNHSCVNNAIETHQKKPS